MNQKHISPIMLRFNQSNVATEGLLVNMEEVDITAMHRITKRGDIIQTRDNKTHRSCVKWPCTWLAMNKLW